MRNVGNITIQMPDGARRLFTGRAGQTLRRLVEAGRAGITSMNGTPGNRLAHYVFLLRKAGLVVETRTEAHGGDYPGHHARYVLETPVTVIEQVAA